MHAKTGDRSKGRHQTRDLGRERRVPAVIQPRWRLSKEYVNVATPLAFLIEEDDVIAKDVALGRDTILALAPTRGMKEA